MCLAIGCITGNTVYAGLHCKCYYWSGVSHIGQKSHRCKYLYNVYSNVNSNNKCLSGFR